MDHALANGSVLDARRALDQLDLRDWQVTAFGAWAGANGRGIVEAITAAGKTRVGLAAAVGTLGRGGSVLVLVPTVELQDQWIGQLRRIAPTARVGRLGGGGQDDLADHDVVVATPQSAADVPVEPRFGRAGLLIADEAHRYGAPVWSAALKEAFALRLALTATYERSDDGIDHVLTPYFGDTVYAYSYLEARRDGVIAPLHLRMVGVELTPEERRGYVHADQRVRELRAQLVGLGLPRDPARLLVAATAAARTESGTEPPGAGGPGASGGSVGRTAAGYLSMLRERRAIAAGAAAKLDVLDMLAHELSSCRSIVFTDTVEQAGLAVGRLTAGGVRAALVHGQLDARTRRDRMQAFRSGRLGCVVAPRVLDEGLDVPDADAAVVLAAFRTPRHLIQRLGRVLRPKSDGRSATFTIVHARDTREDPDRGANAAFLQAVEPIADRVDHVTAEQLHTERSRRPSHRGQTGDVDPGPGSPTTSGNR